MQITGIVVTLTKTDKDVDATPMKKQIEYRGSWYVTDGDGEGAAIWARDITLMQALEQLRRDYNK